MSSDCLFCLTNILKLELRECLSFVCLWNILHGSISYQNSRRVIFCQLANRSTNHFSSCAFSPSDCLAFMVSCGVWVNKQRLCLHSVLLIKTHCLYPLWAEVRFPLQIQHTQDTNKTETHSQKCCSIVLLMVRNSIVYQTVEQFNPRY